MAMDAQIGLGWFLKTSPLSSMDYVIEHSGSTIYHHSQIIMYPEHNIGIVVMANSGIRFSLGDLSGLLFNRASGIPDQQWTAGPGIATGQTSPPFCEAEKIPGHYQSEAGLVNVLPSKKGLEGNVNGTTLYFKKSENGYYDPSIKLLGFVPIGKLIFGERQISWRCQNDDSFAVVRNGDKHFTLAYKVQGNKTANIPEAWLGEYKATQQEARTHFPIIKLWQEDKYFFAETRQFPVHYQAVKFLLNRSAENSARLLYLGDQWGPQMVFTESSGQISLDFMGYHFIKQ